MITAKLRRHKRVLFKIGCGLKTFETMYRSREIRLTEPIESTESLFKHVQDLFWEVYDPKISYRATYVVIYGLRPAQKQSLLFGSGEDDRNEINKAVDAINNRFGKSTLRRASSQLNARDRIARNTTPLLYSRDMSKILKFPYWGECH